jgi:hypothetical protein
MQVFRDVERGAHRGIMVQAATLVQGHPAPRMTGRCIARPSAGRGHIALATLPAAQRRQRWATIATTPPAPELHHGPAA